jgi:cyclophilin family peptidyl-prolyl cis-trans isomerase/HEAT repeat protein
MTIRRLAIPALLVVLGAASLRPQERGADDGGARREKLRTILEIRDLRSTRDALLREYLYDPDSLVRVRATLAYGSLQDTTALQDLVNNLVDGPAGVQEAAAFAIGQTAGLLAPASLAELEHDLIWVRMDRTLARARLIEEVGKFGSAQGLSDLVLRLGTGGAAKEREALVMSIARFAIRKVKTTEATRLVLEDFLDGATPTWREAYALQRIGNDGPVRAEIPRLIRAVQQRDALVRMNLALLFGKLGGDGALVEPLVNLAGFDTDWRVRVNALRALGSFRPDDRILGAMRSAMADGNPSVVITALSVVGGYDFPGPDSPAGLADLMRVVRGLATGLDRGHLWQLRSEAAMALAKIGGGRALPDLRAPSGDEPLLEAGLIAAMGATGSVDALADISPALASGDPLHRRTALEALESILSHNPGEKALRDSVYAANIAALGSGDMAVITTAASNLGDSLLLERGSVPALTGTLGTLRSPADIEAVQEICRTLAKIGDPGAVGPLESVLDAGDLPAARAAAAALTAITGRDYSSGVASDREPLYKDFDFGMLEGLPDTIRVTLETAKGTIGMEWYRDAAPFTIMSMLKLAEGEGFYRGLIFHRVVPNFVIQGGDPRGDGWGGPGYSIRSEFSPGTYETGSIGIASAGKDTEGSQFFITQSPQPHLDGRYTIIGKVVSGMNVVNEIQVGDRILDISRRH